MLQASASDFPTQLVGAGSLEHSLFPPSSGKPAAAQPMTNKRLLEQIEMRDLLSKWGLQAVQYRQFTFDAHFHPYRAQDLLKNVVNQTVNCISNPVESVQFQQLATSVTQLSFFDRLVPGVVRDSGDIIKCFEEYLDPWQMVLTDELQKLLLAPELSDHYQLYTSDGRKEFIFHVFKLLCIGGPVCQNEDTIEPYLEMTKRLYKRYLSVCKDSQQDGSRIIVNSLVYRVIGYNNKQQFDHPQSFFYVVCNPLEHECHVLMHDVMN